MIKITGLNTDQNRAARERLAGPGVEITSTTITFESDALATVDVALAQTSGRGYPRQSLSSIRRKVVKAALAEAGNP